MQSGARADPAEAEQGQYVTEEEQRQSEIIYAQISTAEKKTNVKEF